MFYRWLHKSWKYFWSIIFGILLTVLLLSGIVLGILQLDVTQNYLADRVEQQIERSYKADLDIGDVDGFLPFRVSLYDVSLVEKATPAEDTLLTIRQIDGEIDVWGLLQNKLTIVGFSMDYPKVMLRSNEQGRLVFLQPRDTTRKANREEANPWLSDIEIIAPSVNITGGSVQLEAETQKHQIGNLPRSFSLNAINTSLFVDWSETQRYLDIESFTATSENLEAERISVSGQLYNDHQFLEFNSFYLTLNNSQFVFNGEIDGVNILEPNITEQLKKADYDLDMRSDEFFAEDITDFVQSENNIDQPLSVDIRTEGSADSLWVDRAEFGIGQSYLNLDGVLKNLTSRNRLAYELRFDGLNLRNEDLGVLLDKLALPNNEELQSISVSGQAKGTVENVNADFTFSSSLGALAINGEMQLVPPYHYQGNLQADSLDVSPFLASRIDTTVLNGDAQFVGKDFSLTQAESDVSIALSNSQIGNHRFNQLDLVSSLQKGEWKLDYTYSNQGERLAGSSVTNFNLENPSITFRGDARNINIAHFFPSEAVSETALNFDYNIELEELSLDRLHGRGNLDIDRSLIGRDTVRAHQMYMDLNSPDATNREFRLTSSLFDLNISGQVTPADVIGQTRFWSRYLTDQFKSEVLMTQQVDSVAVPDTLAEKDVVLEGSLQTKDLGLIKKYVPDFPEIYAQSQLSFNVNTDGTRLLFSADIDADSLTYNDFNITDANSQLSASFRSDRNLRSFSTVDWETNIQRFDTPSVDLDSVALDWSVKQDSIYFTQHVGQISNNAQFDLALKSTLSDSVMAISVEQFFLGNETYAWVDQQTPKLRYHRNGEIDFDDFSFENKDEFFGLKGKLSPERSDSLMYTLNDINLQRISDLIKGEIDFEGILNGSLVTKSLTRQPTIQGDLDVSQFRINDRTVGDIRFNSQYNVDNNRFDTQIDIVTDSTKYQNYLDENDGLGQDIHFDGYFVTPDPDVQQDTVYHFDGNFQEVDLWFLGVIASNVFSEVEGRATGTGSITGNLEDYNFESEFQTENVFARPEFLNTNYFLNGPVQFNREEGIVLDSLTVMDTKGGTGTIWGNIDLNDFDPITYLDLAMDMNQLQFLNNSMNPDVPFYGNVSGTGTVRLSGSNTDVYLRTPEQLEVTSDSEVSIPLLEETELQDTGKFIRFVDSFDEANTRSGSAIKTDNQSSRTAQDAIEEVLEELTFSERFDLDLRFNASDNVTVNLIFDPVTGEVLTAQGTGQLRISMQDQDVQMFGQYNISDGDYQFVTGEIISRQLQLESGGTIVWEGPPDNARLDISAVYNARPNVSTLIGEDGLSDQGQNGNQQVPIDLIVEITGTLNSVENNYYFRLPSRLDLSSNSTLQYTLNQINRDEQQKLLQATSVLFTGQFIPTQGIGSGTAMLSQNLARGSTYINPVLSSQVSQLLSDQINTLLNSDVSRLDIDFNLNAYNEVDLGIALRLYNDRLIFRREGQITGGGPQSTPGDRLGDLNATYRIRKGLSLTAFHRQDQALNNIQSAGPQAGDVTPYVDGLGLESQVQFNTWGELMNRIRRVFGGIFGKSDDSTSNEQ